MTLKSHKFSSNTDLGKHYRAPKHPMMNLIEKKAREFK